MLGDYEAEFIAVNMDNTYIGESGKWPGTGSIASALIYSSGRIPTIIGKPSTKLLDCILAKVTLNPNRTCMIGDRIDTDISFGLKGGFNTLLVLTGISDEKELSETPSAKQPAFVCKSLGHLVSLLTGENP